LVEDEQWSQADITAELQRIVNLIVDAAIRDPADFVLQLHPTIAPPLSSPPTSATNDNQSLSSSNKLSVTSPSAEPASPRTRASGSGMTKHLRIEERGYFAVTATQKILLTLTDYLRLIINIQTLTTDTMSRIIEFLKSFNSRTCQVVLGAGAMRSAGLRNITAKHLGLFYLPFEFTTSH
jgi:vacuolar protein sorting-associated protein 54